MPSYEIPRGPKHNDASWRDMPVAGFTDGTFIYLQWHICHTNINSAGRFFNGPAALRQHMLKAHPNRIPSYADGNHNWLIHIVDRPQIAFDDILFIKKMKPKTDPPLIQRSQAEIDAIDERKVLKTYFGPGRYKLITGKFSPATLKNAAQHGAEAKAAKLRLKNSRAANRAARFASLPPQPGASIQTPLPSMSAPVTGMVQQLSLQSTFPDMSGQATATVPYTLYYSLGEAAQTLASVLTAAQQAGEVTQTLASVLTAEQQLAVSGAIQHVQVFTRSIPNTQGSAFSPLQSNSCSFLPAGTEP